MGDISKAEDLIQRTNEAAERLENAIKKQEELNAAADRKKTENVLAGQSEASVPPVEETPQQYAQRMLRGG